MITHDGSINIATGLSKDTRVWKNKKILYSEFVQKLSEDTKTNETHKEFLSATKDEQSKIKDVGGYVGGYLTFGVILLLSTITRRFYTQRTSIASLTLDTDLLCRYPESVRRTSTWLSLDR